MEISCNKKSTEVDWYEQRDRKNHIHAGFVWQPEGWVDWTLRFQPGKIDNRSCCVQAESLALAKPMDVHLLFRVEIAALQQKLHEALLDCEEGKNEYGWATLCDQPTPQLDEPLLESIRAELRALSTINMWLQGNSPPVSRALDIEAVYESECNW